jgi:hypothetical protein
MDYSFLEKSEENAMKPLFIIAGAPKCGTTALWSYLNEHPEVSMSSIKEPRFFSAVTGAIEQKPLGDGPLRSGTYGRGWAWYESLFKDNPSAKLSGEASTHYFSAKDTPSLLLKHMPQVKLIFILRDPVDRLYSHYWQEHKLGLSLPNFGDMIKQNHPRFRFYACVSAYKYQLERYYAVFPSNQILVLLDHELKQSPSSIFKNVCEFLSIDKSVIVKNMGKIYNQQTTPKNRWLERYITGLQNHKIANQIPLGLRKKLGRLRQAMAKANKVDYKYVSLPEHLRADLTNRFEQDILFIERLLLKDLSGWRSKG